MLNPAQQAIAKDWSLVNQKTDWLVSQIIEMRASQESSRKLLVNHNEQLKLQQLFLRIVFWFVPSGVVLLTAIYWAVRFIRDIWKRP